MSKVVLVLLVELAELPFLRYWGHNNSKHPHVSCNTHSLVAPVGQVALECKVTVVLGWLYHLSSSVLMSQQWQILTVPLLTFSVWLLLQVK